MDYQSRYNAIRGDMADEASMLAWQADEGFQEWLRNGPLVIDRHTVTRTGHKRCTVIEPDGTVFTNILFGPTVADNLAAMLAHHRKGKPKPETPQLTDRERIEMLEKRVKRLEDLIREAPEPVEIPEFLQDNPPAELADLFDPADTAPQSNEKLLVRLREVLGLIGLAEDAGGRAAPELYRRKDRLESGIRWNRGRLAEVI
jgi:hypothetical protein